ncbi:MAG TPA: hypothetical protein VIN71_13235 [Pseudomonadales bacterium]
MDFGIVSIVLLVLSALLIMLGMKLLFRRNWFVQFLRGFAGFSLLLLALLVTLSGLNIATYQQLAKGQTIANISFTRTAGQQYQAELVNVATGQQASYEINGDMWQVDARILRLALVARPFYKLDRISGRFYSLEQERTAARSVYSLAEQETGIDLWSLFKGKSLGLIAADYGSATYSPMADGAVFAIVVGVEGLQARPVNDAARQIVNEWL